MVEFFLTGLIQALVLAFVAFGVMIPFRLLNFADLTAEGAFPLGGAVCACLIVLQIHPGIALLIGTFCAGLIGMGTAFIHLRFKVNTLLAGIILSTMLYSVNLRLMGKPNIPLFDNVLIFPAEGVFFKLLVLSGFLTILVVPVFIFLRTECGLRLRAVGLNPQFAKKQGFSVMGYTLFGLFLGNAYNGLAGGLMVQLQHYMDINMGVGIVIHALAALMIGESVLNKTNLNNQFLAPLLGALIYQQIQGLALLLGLAPSDLKFLTGFIVLMVIVLRAKSE